MQLHTTIPETLEADPQAFMDGFDAYIAVDTFLAKGWSTKMPDDPMDGHTFPKPKSLGFAFELSLDAILYDRLLETIKNNSSYESVESAERFLVGAYAAHCAILEMDGLGML